MEFLEAMREYFWGERAESLYFIVPLGIFSLAFAAVVFRTQEGGFMWGMAMPFVVLGALLLVVGASVGLRTPGQVAELTALYDEDVASFVTTELPRMEGVNRMWPIYISVWTTFVVFGLILRFAFKTDWAHGLGPALLFFGAVGFLIDGFAERRARPYTQALENLQQRASP